MYVLLLYCRAVFRYTRKFEFGNHIPYQCAHSVALPANDVYYTADEGALLLLSIRVLVGHRSPTVTATWKTRTCRHRDALVAMKERNRVVLLIVILLC